MEVTVADQADERRSLTMWWPSMPLPPMTTTLPGAGLLEAWAMAPVCVCARVCGGVVAPRVVFAEARVMAFLRVEVCNGRASRGLNWS